MYCSSCGVAITPGLSFCNYCGERAGGVRSRSTGKSPEVRPESLIGAMVVTFVFGLGAITLLIGMMKAILRLEVGLILAFVLLSFLIMLSLEGVFIRLLFRRMRGAKEVGDAVGLKTSELDSAHGRVLSGPMPSVTEHTTRAFDPIYSERASHSSRE